MAVSVDSYLSSSIALQSKTLDLSRKELIVFPPTYHQLKSVEVSSRLNLMILIYVGSVLYS